MTADRFEADGRVVEATIRVARDRAPGRVLAMIAFTLASLFLPGTSELPDRPDIISFVAVGSAFFALPTVGAILAILRPRNPIGWMFLASGAGIVVGIFATEYVGRAVYAGMSLPGVVLVDWLSSWAGCWPSALMVIGVPLLFPDGQLPGPRWRPVAWVAGAATIVADSRSPPRWRQATPTTACCPIRSACPGRSATLWLPSTAAPAWPLIAMLGILSLASVVVRFRRARGLSSASS